ncbi:hypothetical protein ES705_25442 [subsurface metagenome]
MLWPTKINSGIARSGNESRATNTLWGFDADFSCAVTAASSTIGPIIPPSIPLVIYAYMADASVGRLFLGGVLPGKVQCLPPIISWII